MAHPRPHAKRVPMARRPTHWLYRPMLTDDQLTALTSYKYSGEDRSITYRYIMSPLYTRLINYIPVWLAPNAITFLGFLLPILAHIFLLRHTPTLLQEAPSPMYVFAAAALFIYMVLDNLDGKQARRTGSSTPLGHLFDHGCDALNVTVSGMTLLASVRLSPPVMPLSLLFALGHLSFYTSALEEFHTGSMVLRELNGPNEGLLTLCIIHLITAVAGTSFWHMPVVTGWPPLCALLYPVSVMPTLHAVLGNFLGIHSYARNASPTSTTLMTSSSSVLSPSSRKEAATAAAAAAATQLASPMKRTLPMLFAGGVQVLTALLAPRSTRTFIIPLLWQMGLLTFDVIVRIMLATLTRAPFPQLWRLYIPFLLSHTAVLLSDSAVSDIAGFQVVGDVVVVRVVAACLIASALYCAWRTWCLVTQICHFLNIRCFALGPLRPAA